MILCDSAIRPPESVGNAPLLRLAGESGCDGIAVGGGCTLAGAALLAAEALRAGLAVGAVRAPLPEARLAAGKRLPRLGAIERDERAAAVELGRRAIALAAELGDTAVIGLDFGALALAASVAELLRLFRRREMDDGDGESGADLLASARAERRAKIAARLDGCRFSLDALVRDAERVGIALAIELSGTPWGLPSPREGLELLADYAGARVGVVADPARLAVMRRLGLGLSAARLASLRGAARLWADNEAVGLEAGFLPGLGEREADLAGRDGVPARTPVVLVGQPDATTSEVAAAARAATSAAQA
jgi:sugar phosphate isomerase/epimerase